MKNVNVTRYESPACDLFIYADEKHLLAVAFKTNRAAIEKKLAGKFIRRSNAVIEETITQLKQYFSGQREGFDLPLHLHGTEFQEKAWRQLLKIPYGRTISYRDQALKIGSEKAVRAVGSANGRNLLSIVIPCHRVVGADGSLAGYAGGLAVKSFLLKLESGRSL